MQASRVLLLHIIGLTVLPVWAAQVNVYPGDNIQLAINQNPAGSTFILNPGIYRLASPLIPLARDSFIGASPCAPPTTSCTAILSGATEIGSLAIFDGQNYEVGGQSQHGTIGTNACEAGYSGCIYPEALFFDGVPYQHLIGATEPSIASGQWWFDYAHQIIYFHDNPAGHLVETSITPAAFAGNANGVTIQYLEIEEFANTQQTGTISTGSPSTTSGIDWVITNNDIRLNSYWGVKINYGWQVLTNYVYMNGDEGIGGGCSLGSGASIPDSGILIEGNTVTYNNFAGVSPGFGAGGIKLGRCRGVVLRNNIVQHNNGEGIHCDVSCEFPLMDGNTVTDNDGNGLQMEIGGTGINAGAIFRNNILQRNGLGTLSGTPGFNLISQASSNVQAYCNVVEVSSTGQNDAMAIVAGARGSNPFPPGGLYSSSGNYFYRNTVIWDGSSSSNYNGATQFDTTNQPTFFTSNTGFDYNGYHLPNINTGSFRWDGNDTGDNTPKTFAQLQLVGQEPHGTVDTNFTSGFPSISITSPPDGSQVAGGTPVAVSASDTNGISRVEFYLDWQLQATLMGNPYSFDLPVDNPGQHTLSAIAYSNTGVTRCYAESLTISNAAPGATLYPQNLAFGNQNVGVVSAAQSVTLSNSGNAPLAVTGVAVGGTNAADF
ncbi:MAG: right-handed parallel beta-helix repeat-containing protein, partial [Bryobacterales bacterium]|nr:right-handed parallel beta-helix repeat-containing protein [Bryobacterales bacterium]